VRLLSDTLQGDALLNEGRVLLSCHLVRDLARGAVERPLRVVVVQSDSESQLAHALVELVEDGEVSVNSVVLGDELKQRHFDVAQDDVVASI